jgi:hypothetical protein
MSCVVTKSHFFSFFSPFFNHLNIPPKKLNKLNSIKTFQYHFTSINKLEIKQNTNFNDFHLKSIFNFVYTFESLWPEPQNEMNYRNRSFFKQANENITIVNLFGSVYIL